MRFRVLGPLEIGPDGAATRITGRKERAVLGALIAGLGSTRSAEELLGAVWGEDAPPSAAKSLQVRLSHLRSELRRVGVQIERDGHGYRLAAEPDDVDCHRFAALVEAAAGAPPREALARLDEALSLVRGPPYADVDEFDGLAAEARRLEELRLRAVEGRLRALLALGRHAEALPELERAVSDEPHHEELAGLLMLALYRAGRQVEALATYRRTAERLRELGLEPSQELRRLEGRILVHDDEVAAPRDTSTTNLPARLTSFVGRAAELDAIGDRLRTHRLVTVTGPGGVGKTSVAIEAVRGLADRVPDGVWLVELAAITAAEQIPATVADALPFGAAGPDLQGDGREAIDALCERLGGRRALLVLNDCEHLAAAVGRVAARVLEAAPGVRILATSRQPLGAPGESVLDVRPFAPGGQEALRLFVERARAAYPDFRLDAEARAAATTVCERLDGLPLAIELAAARMRALGPAELAARLDDRFAVLGDPLGRMVAWSFEHLGPAERDLFCRLAVFRGPFDVEAAERIAGGDGVDRGAVGDLLVALVDRSMVVAEADGHRMLETLRAFGLQRLEEAGDLPGVRVRHAAWAAEVAHHAAGRLYAEGVDAVRRALAPRRADLDQAVDLALAEREGEQALALASGLGILDFGLGDGNRARTRLARALRLDAPPAARLPALALQSVLLTLHGLTAAGAQAADEALDEAPDERWRDRALAFRGCARLLAADAAGALADLAGLEERLRGRGETWLRGFVSGWQGFVRLALGDLPEAERLSRRAVDAFEGCGDVWGLLTASVNLARVDLALGDYDDAAEVLERARRAGEARVPTRLGPLLHDLGLVELRRARFDRAAELWRRCAAPPGGGAPGTGGWVLLSGPAERWYAFMAQGHLARLDGDDTTAAARYAQARVLLEAVERDQPETIGVHAAIATALLAQGDVADPEEAAGLLTAALDRALESGDRRLSARVLDALARVDPDPVRGAELLGAAEGVRDGAGGELPPVERRAVDAIALALRTLAGDEAFEAALERGRRAPFDVAATQAAAGE